MSGCHNPSEDRTTLHRLPFHDSELLRKWLEKIDLKSDPTEETRICSLHFDDGSFQSRGELKVLLPTSVPFNFKVNFWVPHNADLLGTFYDLTGANKKTLELQPRNQN